MAPELAGNARTRAGKVAAFYGGLPRRARCALRLLLALEVVLIAAAQRDIGRRPAEAIREPKGLWRAIATQLLAAVIVVAAVVAAVNHSVSPSAPRPAAPVTVASSDPLPVPGERLTFSGRVSQGRPRGRVLLQEQAGASWATIASGYIQGNSRFALSHTFPVAGVVTVRAALPSAAGHPASHSAPLKLSVSELHKIKHVVVIMQENRSFDQYFGTFPNADGIPGLAGHRGKIPCLPSHVGDGCVKPFHDRRNSDFGGPHASWNSTADMACSNPSKRTGCRMNGFVDQAQTGGTPCRPYHPGCSPCRKVGEASCVNVMAYHDSSEIPNYWKYARDFVLQDHMFESTYSWSLQAHMYMVSEWSALCANARLPSSCKNELDRVAHPEGAGPHYAWTDITYLLHRNHVSWGYYVFKGNEPDCESNAQLTCKQVKQGPTTPGIWNPLPWFTDVGQDHQLRDIQSLTRFFGAAKAGRLPAVSWIDPNGDVSEHPPALVSRGQTYVTGLINAIMQSPDWNSTAIFLAWDDWGGFYDNAVPPLADQNGFGLRVPAMVISPYARRSYVDHQTLSFDAYNKFIENDFLGGQRLNPNTDGRPDPRPDVRETLQLIGELSHDFNFAQPPRPPLMLPVCPLTDLVPQPRCH